ncbi:hypothetical protein ZWY2020_022981 [Hordeum vulgare]|nr:hypothetical protein ZWY2020_022981 [Hordeum vulgare]
MRLAPLPHLTDEGWPSVTTPPPSRRATDHFHVSRLHHSSDLGTAKSISRRQRPYQGRHMEPSVDGKHVVTSWVSEEGVGHGANLLPYDANDGVELRSPEDQHLRRRQRHEGFARWRPSAAASEGNPRRLCTPKSSCGTFTTIRCCNVFSDLDMLTIEALSIDVSMIPVPRWSDQPTNAKYVKDVSHVGVQVQGVVTKEELARCVGEVMDVVKGYN